MCKLSKWGSKYLRESLIFRSLKQFYRFHACVRRNKGTINHRLKCNMFLSSLKPLAWRCGAKNLLSNRNLLLELVASFLRFLNSHLLVQIGEGRVPVITTGMVSILMVRGKVERLWRIHRIIGRFRRILNKRLTWKWVGKRIKASVSRGLTVSGKETLSSWVTRSSRLNLSGRVNLSSWERGLTLQFQTFNLLL